MFQWGGLSGSVDREGIVDAQLGLVAALPGIRANGAGQMQSATARGEQQLAEIGIHAVEGNRFQSAAAAPGHEAAHVSGPDDVGLGDLRADHGEPRLLVARTERFNRGKIPDQLRRDGGDGKRAIQRHGRQ